MPAGPFPDAAALGAYLGALAAASDGLCLCVTDAATGQPLGAVNYLANRRSTSRSSSATSGTARSRRAPPSTRRPPTCCCEHAFGLGYRRVEWKCDAFNRRSRKAAERLGFTFEGIQDAHYIVKGRNRDTAWFRMLDREWPSIRDSAPSARPYWRS